MKLIIAIILCSNLHASAGGLIQGGLQIIGAAYTELTKDEDDKSKEEAQKKESDEYKEESSYERD